MESRPGNLLQVGDRVHYADRLYDVIGQYHGSVTLVTDGTNVVALVPETEYSVELGQVPPLTVPLNETDLSHEAEESA